MTVVAIHPVGGLPEITAGADLPALLAAAFAFRDGDVLVVAQKVVSKAEGRVVTLADVAPGALAREIAGDTEDPRFTELVLRESRRVVRRRGSFLICETHHGFVCASAGVDRSNAGADGVAILLPADPDASARALRAAIDADVAVVVSDSFGRPFRQGITGVAIGCAGLEPVENWIGRADDDGRPFAGTAVHLADELAAAADLLLGPAGRVPAAVVRGVDWPRGVRGAADLVMPSGRDLFP
jgi:coenzyme F420-0:L-glutamate ligase/coenzyme F420-1:gamma-L-glutamate ligase